MPEKEVIYFSHDANSRNDPKVLKLRLKLNNMEGYGIYFCLLEMMREQPEFKLSLDYEAIAFGLNVSSDLVQKVVNDFELFVVQSDCFYSESLIRRMNKMKEKSFKASQSAKKRWDLKPEKETEPKEIPKNNQANKLDFDQIKLHFQKQTGLSKPYFVRMQDLHSLPESEIISQFDKWKTKNESNAFTIKHAENSFNIWLGNYKENKNGTTKAGKQPKQNGSKQLGSIYEKISGIHRE